MAVRVSNATWLAPGCRLDRYDLLLQVAEGGMGSLWLARQEGKHGFDKVVAIKTILPKLASNTAFRRMFLDEARVVSRIEHPNVAQVLDLGEERGVLFLVMEWIDGESLVNVNRIVAHESNATVSVGVLARIMVDVCAGLHAAHEATDDDGVSLGVVHRDVSPHNLLVEYRGTTKVIDFGIAMARNRMGQDTTVGHLKGKIAYMAPEQALGNRVDRRSDVWSAGASMYRFLAGRVPYSASEPLGVLRRISLGPPPMPLPATVPEPIRRVVERAIDADPTERFETARDLGMALETAMDEARIPTTREHVALFMTEHLGNVRAMRTAEIERVVRESRQRMRVERAHAGPARPPSEAPARPSDRVTASWMLSAESWDEAVGIEPPADALARASRYPTVVAPAPASASRRPTVVGPTPPPNTERKGAETPRGGIQVSGGPDTDRLGRVVGAEGAAWAAPEAAAEEGEEGDERAATHPSVSLQVLQRDVQLPPRAMDAVVKTAVRSAPERTPSRPLFRAPSRPLFRAIAGAGVLGISLVGGLAWWAMRSPARPVAAANGMRAAARLPEPHGVSTVVPSLVVAAEAQAPLAAVEAAVAMPVGPGGASVALRRSGPGAALAQESGSVERRPEFGLLERARAARRAGRIGEAAALFAAAVEQTPADSEALTGLAEVDDAQGATAAAIVHYRRAIAVNPRYLQAHLGLADALWTAGRRDEARAAYRRIVDQFSANLYPDVVRQRAAGNAENGNTPN